MFIFSYDTYRCEEEDVKLAEPAAKVLAQMATETTLRYALNLISCGQVLARKRRASEVAVEDLRRAYTYFMDEPRSVKWLKEQEGTLMFEEVGGGAPADGDTMDES